MITLRYTAPGAAQLESEWDAYVQGEVHGLPFVVAYRHDTLSLSRFGPFDELMPGQTPLLEIYDSDGELLERIELVSVQ